MLVRHRSHNNEESERLATVTGLQEWRERGQTTARRSTWRRLGYIASMGLAAAVAGATLVVPSALAIQDGPAVPGCKVTVEAGDEGLKLASRGFTDSEDFFDLNPNVDWDNLRIDSHVITEECGDLGTDHQVEEISH